MSLVLTGTTYHLAAIDGHDLNDPGLLGVEQLVLDVGQRLDLTFTMPSGGAVQLLYAGFAGMMGSPGLPAATVSLGAGPSADLGGLGSAPPFEVTAFGKPVSGGLEVGHPMSTTT